MKEAEGTQEKRGRNPDLITSVHARFTPKDFAVVIKHLPSRCPMVGGQAVAWWAARYQRKGPQNEAITSADIDFWGAREDLQELARRLERKPVYPNEYEMTVWLGAIPLEIESKKTLAEFLHSVPGLDVINPEKASVEQQYQVGSVNKIIEVLSPVSLVHVKLHALRHFSQKDRQDELHLRICLQTSHAFLTELLRMKEIRQVLWNSERLIAAHQLKPYARLEQQYGLQILDAIPIDEMKEALEDPAYPADARTKLANFVKLRWRRLIGKTS